MISTRSTIFVILGMLLMFTAGCSGCTGSTKIIKKQYSNITTQNFEENCSEPQEAYNVSPIRFPITAQVTRHKNCMGVPDLLVVTWAGDTSEKNLTAARLLMLMYIEYQSADGFKITGKYLKKDKVHSDEDPAVNMAFYELRKVVKELENENH